MTERAGRAWTTSYRARWVLPISTEPIRDGAVVVEDGRIAWVGRAGEEPHRTARVVELGDSIISPGLVNTHTHLDLTVLHGLLDGLAFFDWIRAVVACREQLTPDELLDSARLGVISGLEAGITTFADTAPVAAPFDAMLEFGVRGIAYQEVFGPEPADAATAVSALGERVATLRARETSHVRVGVSPHAPYSVSDALFVAAAAYARTHGLPIATHLAESAAETELLASATGPFAAFLRSRGIGVDARAHSPVGLLSRLGVLGSDTLLIHCVRCDSADVATIAGAGAAVATCPRSNAYFRHGNAPVAALRAAGVRVGVGSDSMASNSSMDLLAEADFALSVPDAGGAAVAPSERWKLATADGAAALGLGDRIGTLEPGKDADLSVFPADPGVEGTGSCPGVATGRGATLVVVAGVERLRDGRVVAGVAGISARTRLVADRLREWRRRAALP